MLNVVSKVGHAGHDLCLWAFKFLVGSISTCSETYAAVCYSRKRPSIFPLINLEFEHTSLTNKCENILVVISMCLGIRKFCI